MESAKASYLADLEAGFQVLHIDPSIDIHGDPNVDEVLARVFDLYEYCWSQAQRLGREVIFEIGTEEQSGSTNTQEELDYTLNAVLKFCKSNRIAQPSLWSYRPVRESWRCEMSVRLIHPSVFQTSFQQKYKYPK